MIVIIGLPDSGKTTFSKRFSNVIHYDDISHLPRAKRVEITAKASCAEGIYNSKKCRSDILERVKDCDKVCYWIDTPVDICLERERNGRMRGDYLVTHHAKTFEPPTLDEGWDEIIIVRNNESISYKRET